MLARAAIASVDIAAGNNNGNSGGGVSSGGCGGGGSGGGGSGGSGGWKDKDLVSLEMEGVTENNQPKVEWWQ